MDSVGVIEEVFLILSPCLSSPKNILADGYPAGLTTHAYLKLEWLKSNANLDTDQNRITEIWGGISQSLPEIVKSHFHKEIALQPFGILQCCTPQSPRESTAELQLQP